jgi:hypothetical protein
MSSVDRAGNGVRALRIEWAMSVRRRSVAVSMIAVAISLPPSTLRH